MIFITVLMMLFVINFASQKTDFVVVSRIEGIIFLLLFIGFIFYLYRMAQQDRKENHDKVESHSPLLKIYF